MWWGKKQEKPATAEAKPVEVWDEKTQQYIAQRERLDIQITSVVRRYGFGVTEANGQACEAGYEIHGIMTLPKLILVEITAAENEAFGGWSYDIYNHSLGENTKKLPLMNIWISDRDWKKQQAIYTSHMAALVSGRRSSTLGLWKKKGEGLFNEADKEHGYSYSSKYSLLGMYVWSELQSTSLPKWARPYASEGFSLDGVPDSFFRSD